MENNNDANAGAALDLLLGDFDRREFFDDYWERASLYLAHDDRERFAHLLNRERFVTEEAFQCDGLSVRLDAADASASEMDVAPDQVPKFFEAGMTIVAPELPRARAREEFIESFRKDVFPSAPVHFGASYSPAGKGRGLRLDACPTWLMQVEGRRHCRVGRKPAVQNPERDVVFPLGRDGGRDSVEPSAATLPRLPRPEVENPDEFRAVALEPGDVLYVPAGTWLQTRADGYSLGLTLHAARITAFDLLFTVVQHSLAVPEFKVLIERIGGVDAARVKDGRLSDDVEAVLAGRLEIFKGLVSRIQLSNLHKAFEHLSTVSDDQIRMLKQQTQRDL